ncbi:hypothetical protein niasHT_036331 [Heterodera trifolii]|uniref:BTB domain-containing protein n=1 Tax=Heterodera trifolii TaxID=157864 RepID=A0ABD2J3M7_9BILA
MGRKCPRRKCPTAFVGPQMSDFQQAANVRAANEFLAHKTILLASSDMFKAMFRFDEQIAMREANSTPPVAKRAKTAVVVARGRAPSAGVLAAVPVVVVPDVTTEAFKAMLEFIYADDLSGLNGDNLFDVLYAANKYQINLLADACVDFPIYNVQNIFKAFERAHFYGEEASAFRCLNYINFNNELTMKQFLKVNNQLLCQILCSLPQKPSGEIAIWNATLRWADEQCVKNGKECTGENRREMLGPALYKIRFPLIAQNDFSNQIVPSDVLTKDEMLSVFLSYSQSLPVSYPLHFPTDQRMAVQKSSSALHPRNTALNKRSGRITMKIENFFEFARENKRRYSDAVNIRGFSWRIFAEIQTTTTMCDGNKNKKCLGIFLHCEELANKECNWCCNCSATLQIVAQKKNKDSKAIQFIGLTFKSVKPNSWGWSEFVTFEQLMNAANGWYNEKDDSVILAADVSTYSPAYPHSWSQQKQRWTD